jgi:ectoine hydroxylase-related dioxygenase (phytanoyl-CoA dioxygenase family)
LLEAALPTTELYAVSDEAVEAYRRDGAVMLKGVLDGRWLEVLAQGIALNRAEPSKRKLDWVKDEAAGESLLFDAMTVAHNPHYERYMLHSPIGPIAARMLGSPTALAFYVSVFIRSAGTKSRTPWHQDQTYWSAEGRQALSIWTSLDPVPEGTALEFVRGSHLWDRPLARPHFGQQNLGGVMDIEGLDAMPIPDFSGIDRDRYEFVSWAMEPGDVVIFHGMTVHGGSGSLPAGLARRSISAQWLGEDARITDRLGGCDPDWLPELAEQGLAIGDYPACAMCPTVTAEGVLIT